MVTVSPTLFVYQVKFDETINRKQCDEYGWSEENRTRFSYALTVMIYFLPLIILTVWYTRIVHYIWFRKIPGIENLPLYMHMKMKKKYFKRRKLIRMLLVVVITFALCNLPHHVITILWYSRNELNWTPPRSMIFIAFHAEILLYLNAALNPLVYGFLHGKIRYVIFKRFLSNRSHRILRLLYWVSNGSFKNEVTTKLIPFNLPCDKHFGKSVNISQYWFLRISLVFPYNQGNNQD